ncbi:hypothetical protein [Streptomyces yaizuensis]|uniref:Uncharacterized protein n=1 Tax=Streptomyces yaizuensis TaxID=2989713 RepID=A0ABQ5NQM2_9ACTN|nr:hypothetical protein [Streptomyces sp. YSPA8]GLF92688.1 hypothetical protein SYYSPA8_00345 [Streptomyces sp. YSPA8]
MRGTGCGARVPPAAVRSLRPSPAQAGAVWVDLDPAYRQLFGRSLGVRMPDKRLWNPLGKVEKRFEHGPPKSVSLLFHQLHGRVPRHRRARR